METMCDDDDDDNNIAFIIFFALSAGINLILVAVITIICLFMRKMNQFILILGS